MKKYVFYAGLSLLVSADLSAQCLEALSCTWNDDGTATIEVTVLDGDVFFGPGFVQLFPSGGTLEHTLELSLDQNGFQETTWYAFDIVNGSPVLNCIYYFTPNVDAYLDYGDVSLVHESGCEECDGEVCVSMDGFTGLTFVTNSTNSSSGCVDELCAGVYEIEMDPLIDTDGVEYIHDFTLEYEILNFSASLFELSGDVYAALTGGSGNYTITITDFALNSDSPSLEFNGSGCYTAEVVDETTECEFIVTQYVPQTCFGDFTGTGDVPDGVINTADLLFILSNYDNPGFEPAADIDCDGVVGILDLLLFFTVYATSC